MHVVKVGGSILKGSEDLALIRNKIEACEKCIIVTSAMRNVTNNLIEAINTRNTGIIDTIFTRHMELMNNFYDKDSYFNLLAFKNDVLNNLLRPDTPENRDLILSYGEKMAVMVLYSYLKHHGLDVDYYIEPFIVTDDNFGDASCLYKYTEENLKNMEFKHKITIVPGFTGKTLSGKVTTLGRGGSDYTAVLLGRFLHCSVRLITDVPGIMTYDPKVFPDARTLPEVSIKEAIKMSYVGVKNFNYKTFSPAIDSDIEITIESLYEEGKTVITHNEIKTIKCIALTGTYGNKNMLVFIGHGLSEVDTSSQILNAIGKTHLYHLDDTSLSVIMDEDLEKNKRYLSEVPLWTK
ncbi:amino acid kinase family protein [Acidiplasma aeolicum]|uniref:Aspartate/glutamate/uridylate kinase domain-containing protein n=1 Tax=Acidiplasma aeolicum TaxID=507754 RepID=A0A0Q0RHS2_9ARCH|nr:aspartate kinase [Acidiplasma aeolicum]KQB34853.1 hypothetical protein AOG54_03585 [Acidiplasma aeolicum]